MFQPPNRIIMKKHIDVDTLKMFKYLIDGHEDPFSESLILLIAVMSVRRKSMEFCSIVVRSQMVVRKVSKLKCLEDNDDQRHMLMNNYFHFPKK